MKFNTTQICINCPWPTTAAGFAQQTFIVEEYHDDVHARIFGFEDDNRIIYLISCDNLGLPQSVHDTVTEILNKNSEKPVSVAISATHTHFAPSPRGDGKYSEYLGPVLAEACRSLELIEGNYEIGYQCVPFDEVGRSRITGHTAEVLLQPIWIIKDGIKVGCLMTHNVHPTIMHGNTPFFSAEYPGYVIKKLTEMHPETAFTFMQGADGDISTRFTRTTQDYEGVKYLGDKLVNKMEELYNAELNLSPLTALDYECEILPLEHTFEEIDISHLPDNLSPREIETIHIGAKVRKNLASKLDTLPKEILISVVRLGKYNLVFSPNELFSYYIKAMNREHSVLVAYSNGYRPYVSGIEDNFITYETFTDTLTKETKQNYFNLLKKYGA